MRILLALFLSCAVAGPSWASTPDPIAELIAASGRQYSRLALLPARAGQSADDVERVATETSGVVFRGATARPDGSWEVSAAPRGLGALRELAQALRRSGAFVWVEVEPDQFQSQAKRAKVSDELASIGGIRSLIVTATDSAALPARLSGTGMTVRHHLYGDMWVIALPRAKSYAEAMESARMLVDTGIARFADPDLPVIAQLVPNDPFYRAQWSMFDPFSSTSMGIQVERVWDVTQGDPNLVIAVIDTGSRPHPEYAARLLPGYTFISNSKNSHDGLAWHEGGNDPGDWKAAGECGPGSPAAESTWHGTHVTGTIAAEGNNGVGVAGINWLSRILPIRVLGTCSSMNSTSDIFAAMLWAAGLPVAGAPPNLTPARVINMSLGGVGRCTPQYQGIVNRVLATGALIVASAGNKQDLADNYVPASCLGLSTVGATGPTGDLATYSNFSFFLDISAPGGDMARFGQAAGIYSTINNGATGPTTAGGGMMQGTSMAAPHVSGVASLMLSVNPSLTPADLKALMALLPTPFPPDSLCTLSICGAGIVNAATSVALAGLAALVSTVPVVEYHHAGFDHYFVTASADEIRALDAGAFGGAWVRTGGTFRAYTSAVAGGLPVCRFFSTAFAPKSSHFYTANAGECASLKANPKWTYEGIAFHVLMPSASGTCQDGAAKVYRLYNNGRSGAPNHRFTTDPLVQQTFARNGWVAEGAGPIGVGMCSPQF